jgi:hypothetical protein
MILPNYPLRLDYCKICICPSSNGKRPQAASSKYYCTIYTLLLDNANVLTTNLKYVDNSRESNVISGALG